MNQYLENRQKQHYVPQAYLDNWLNVEGYNIQGINVQDQNGNKYLKKQTKDIAQERFFYELELDELSYGMLQYRYQDKGEAIQHVLAQMEVLVGINNYRNAGETGSDKLKIITRNFLEVKYGEVESSCMKSLNKLVHHKIDYLQGLKKGELSEQDLILFFFFQLFRTKEAKQNAIDHLKEMRAIINGEEHYLSSHQVYNYTKASLFLEGIFNAENFVKNGYLIQVLFNDTPEFFVTSTSPATIEQYREGNINSFSGFIPLSPKVGLRLAASVDESSSFTAKSIELTQVRALNSLTLGKKNTTIFTCVVA